MSKECVAALGYGLAVPARPAIELGGVRDFGEKEGEEGRRGNLKEDARPRQTKSSFYDRVLQTTRVKKQERVRYNIRKALLAAVQEALEASVLPAGGRSVLGLLLLVRGLLVLHVQVRDEICRGWVKGLVAR